MTDNQYQPVHRGWPALIEAYRNRMPVGDDWKIVTLLEGATPLISAPVLSEITGCDALAIAVGSVHAMQSQEAELDQERIRACAATVSVPLVLHGSSGVTEESIRQAIANGVSKINVGTYLTAGFCEALRRASEANPREHDMRKLLGPARDEVRKRVREKIRLFGSSGKAGRAAEDGAFADDAGPSFAAVE